MLTRARDNKQQAAAPTRYNEYSDQDYYFGGYGQVEPDNQRYELETEDLLEGFRHELQSKYEDENGAWRPIKGVPPILIDAGIAYVLSQIRAAMNRGTYLGNIEPDRARLITREWMYNVADALTLNREKFGLSRENYTSLVMNISVKIFLALTRPIGDKERIYRNGRFKNNENYSHDEVRPGEIRDIRL